MNPLTGSRNTLPSSSIAKLPMNHDGSHDSGKKGNLTEKAVFLACQEIADSLQRVTLDAVAAKVGRGSRTTIQAMVKKWRATMAANDVAPNIPYPVLESLDAWFGDQRKGLETEAAKAI